MSDSFWTPGDQFLVWALNVVLQVGLVAALAMLIGLTLRRSSAARYWLLCSALLVVMVCPVLTAVVQSSGLSLISVGMIGATPRIEEVPPNVNSMAPRLDESRQNRTSIDASVVPSMVPAEINVAAFEGHDDPVSDAFGESVGAAPVPAVNATASMPTLPQSLTKLGRVLRIVGPPLVAIWAIIAIVLLMRLFIQWHRLSLLLRSAKANTDEGFANAFQSACTALGIRPERVPTLVFSSDVSGPIAAGIRSPKVVFPTAFVRQINSEQLRDILIHEVAHIVRGDQLVVLLQNFAGAVFWIHPLVRLLNRHLAKAREEVCDNYVLAATDAPSYSRTLLTLGQLLSAPRQVPGAVGLFTSRWKLEHRVAGLLDARRNRVTRLSKAAFALIGILSLLFAMTAAIATMSLASASPNDEVKTGDQQKPDEVVATDNAPHRESRSKGSRMEFIAVDTQGNPIEGMQFLPSMPGSELRGRTDASGRWIWENAPDKVFKYQIIHREYLAQPIDSDYGPEDSPVTLKFRKAIPVIGTVVDAETGKSITEFRLYKGAHFKANAPDTWSWRELTSQSGRPAKGSWAEGVIDVDPGTPIGDGRFLEQLNAIDRMHRYRIRAEGYFPEFSRILDPATLPDETIRLEFRLRKAEEVRYRIVTPDAEAAVDARVVTKVNRHTTHQELAIHNGAASDSEHSGPSVVTSVDDQGSFGLPFHYDPFTCLVMHKNGWHQLKGGQHLHTYAAGHRLAMNESDSLELKHRELPQNSQLTLKSWAAVECSVTIDGNPIEGLPVSIEQSDVSLDPESPAATFSAAGTTDAVGRFEWLEFPQGRFTLQVNSGDGDRSAGGGRIPTWDSRYALQLTAGETTKIELGLSTVNVVGRVVLPAGVTPDMDIGSVYFCRESTEAGRRFFAESHQARVKADGIFRCFHLRAGHYKGYVLVGTESRQSFTKNLVLTPEMFEQSSPGTQIDLGDIEIETAQP